jgi:hypothetical protein
VLLLAGASLAGCLSAKSIEPLPAGGHHVLFVGNSLTYVNDLPRTVAAIATAGGDTIRVASSTGGNLALIDHLTGSSDAPQRIANDRWEYVILQQGPTPAGICRDSLVLWSKMFEPRIRAAGAQPALLMTWPGATFQSLWDDVRISFQNAATAVNGTFMPAGEAWRAAWKVDPSLPLYGPDGFHPAPAGTYLTALTIYERVTGKDARSLPARAFSNGEEFSLPVETIRLLQRAAHDANAQFPARSAAPAAPSRTSSAGATSC